MLATLDLPHVRALNARQVGQRLLRDPLFQPFFSNHSAKCDGWFRFIGG